MKIGELVAGGFHDGPALANSFLWSVSRCLSARSSGVPSIHGSGRDSFARGGSRRQSSTLAAAIWVFGCLGLRIQAWDTWIHKRLIDSPFGEGFWRGLRQPGYRSETNNGMESW